MIITKRLYLSFILALPIFWGGCVGEPGSNKENKEPATDTTAASTTSTNGQRPASWLVKRIVAEPNVLNLMHDQHDAYSQEILDELTYETLVKRNNETLEFEPLLAESWEESEDHLTWTFHLRKDVKWHDGKPFTAHDIKFSFDLMKDPAFPATSIESYFSDCDRVEVVDDYTVKLIWSKPYFLALSVGGSIPIVPAHAFDGVEDKATAPILRTPIGTGPYKFVEWKSGVSATFELFDDYWGEKPKIERVIYRFIPDQNTSIQALKGGEIDLVPRVETETWFSETNKPDFEKRFHKYEYDYPAYSYIGWNMRRPIFQDKRVRQAMTMLIDRKNVAEKLYYQAATVITGPFFHKLDINDKSIEPWPFDPQRASKLLAEAGWKDSNQDGILDKDGMDFKFEFLYPSSSEMAKRIGSLMQDQMRKVGIVTELVNLEWGSFLTRVVTQRDFDAMAMGWAMDIDNDPQQLWHSSYADIPDSSNHCGFKNEEADRLIELIRNADTSDEERFKAYHAFHALLHEEQPYTFLISRKEFMAVDKRWQNIRFYAVRPCYDITEWSF